MKKYELIKEGNDWELYFLDNDFQEWHYVRTYKNNDTIKKVYDDIKATYNDLDYNILLKFNF